MPGEDAAFSRIQEHLPALYRYAHGLTCDGTAAEDLVQDCIERALAHRDRWRPTGSFRSWLFTILHNIYRNQRRSAGRRPPQVRVEEAVLPGRSPSQTTEVELNEVLACLAQLPEKDREVILLVGVENLSYAEAARVLDVPVGTIMSRLTRARERLRAAVDTAGEHRGRRVHEPTESGS